VNEEQSTIRMVSGLKILSSGFLDLSSCQLFKTKSWGDTISWGYDRQVRSFVNVPLYVTRKFAYIIT
jgi:hypothetical protein